MMHRNLNQLSESERAFARVSPTFHRIVLPYKFRSLTFKFMNGTAPIIPKFFKAINAGDAHALSLAPLVQEPSLLCRGGLS